MAALQQRGITTSRDRTGGLSLVAKFIVDTLEETQSVAPEGNFLGLPEDSRTSHQQEGGPGRHVVLITYKGISVETAPDKERWSGKLKYREDPIETHPNLTGLLEQYEGRIEDGKAVWPRFLSGSKASGGRGLATGSNASKLQPNPMFNAKTWPILMGEVTRSYVRRSFPPEILRNPGKVLDRLPGNSGIPTPEGYVWLTQVPEFDQQGPEGWALVEHYDLVPQDASLAIIYKLIKRS